MKIPPKPVVNPKKDKIEEAFRLLDDVFVGGDNKLRIILAKRLIQQKLKGE